MPHVRRTSQQLILQYKYAVPPSPPHAGRTSPHASCGSLLLSPVLTGSEDCYTQLAGKQLMCPADVASSVRASAIVTAREGTRRFGRQPFPAHIHRPHCALCGPFVIDAGTQHICVNSLVPFNHARGPSAAHVVDNPLCSSRCTRPPRPRLSSLLLSPTSAQDRDQPRRATEQEKTHLNRIDARQGGGRGASEDS